MTIKYCSWEEVLRDNCDLPSGDITKIKDGKAFYQIREKGDFVNASTAKIFLRFFDFVSEQQYIRKTASRIPHDWVEFCTANVGDDLYMCPRWTFPFCYFGKKYAPCFKGTIGLDVGCNILPHSLKKFFDSFVDPNCNNYLSEFETFIPHYKHYKRFGCNMWGIDICPISACLLEEEYGDLRMLEAGDSIVDFFTVAMIFGPGNAACTFLDTALCLGELRRSCSRNGLIYIAEFVVKPSLVLCAINAGLRVFANNSYQNEVPIGIFFIRNDCEIKNSSFHPILEYLIGFELSFTDAPSYRILNRELLRKNSPPPKVEPITSCDNLKGFHALKD